MTRQDAAEAVFGGFDGLVSTVGVIVAALVAGHGGILLVKVAVGLAVASALSMAGGDWEAYGSRRRATVMGLATVVGCVLPILPFVVLHGAQASAGCVIVCLLVAAVISLMRARRVHLVRALLQTYGILAVAAGATVAVAVILGAA
jgi:VIT1/CCC1 family predicted Fe2+/Mn2+ transporter